MCRSAEIYEQGNHDLGYTFHTPDANSGNPLFLPDAQTGGLPPRVAVTLPCALLNQFSFFFWGGSRAGLSGGGGVFRALVN